MTGVNGQISVAARVAALRKELQRWDGRLPFVHSTAEGDASPATESNPATESSPTADGKTTTDANPATDAPIATARTVMRTGCEPLDRRLPGGGWHRGQLVEWLADDIGSGVELLVLQGVRAALAANPQAAWVVIDRDGTFYPPITLGWGLDLKQLIVVRPQNKADELWALDQVLRCRSVAIVMAWVPRVTPRDFRRLQLAAEEGATVGCFIRPAQVRGEPSWADIQLFVQSLPIVTHCRRWQIEIVRCRGGRAGQLFWVECEEPAGRMREVTP